MKLWKNTTGTAKIDDRFVRFGHKGSADILGIMMGGRFLAIEVKTGRAVQTVEQQTYQRIVEMMGGLYVLARSVEDVAEALSPAS